MIVYGDILFAENLIIGGVLLYITGEIFRVGLAKKSDKLRLAAGSLMCGVFSLTIFLPVKGLMAIVVEIAFAFIVCFTVFGKKMLWQKAFTFILVTYFMGGIAMGLLLVTHNQAICTATGIYTGDMKAGLLALFVGLLLFTSKQIIRTIFKRKFHQEHFFHVKVSIGNFFTETKAFLDTGNRLTEPISGKPVAVAEERLWQELQRAGVLAPERACLVPYESIGSKGLLQGLRTEYIEINGRRIKGCVIAKSDGNFCLEKQGIEDCRLLLSKYMADSKA